MKIGFIIGSLDYSGAEKIARYLLAALRAKGHEVGVLLLSKKEEYTDLEGVKQFPIHTTGGRFKRVLARQRAIKSIVKSEGYDVVVSFGVKFNIDAMEALRGSRVPVILCERNDPVSDPRSKLLRLRRALIYKKAKGFVFQTERIADFFGKKIKARSAVIPNFIEVPYENVYNAEGTRNMMITARLDDNQKNISMLLRAFARFSADHDYKLYIVGDGPDRAKFEALIAELGIAERVILTGKQNVREYLPLAEIFVLPSNYEGMPNSLIEAMASGLPSIATDCSGGGAAELIRDRVSGLLIPVGDEEALLFAMRELADNPELRASLSAEAHKINERLEFTRIIDMWVNYIESVSQS